LTGTSVALWHHHDSASESENACQVCHVAHFPLLSPKLTPSSALLVVISFVSPAPEQNPGFAPVAHLATPRAPPLSA